MWEEILVVLGTATERCYEPNAMNVASKIALRLVGIALAMADYGIQVTRHSYPYHHLLLYLSSSACDGSFSPA